MSSVSSEIWYRSGPRSASPMSTAADHRRDRVVRPGPDERLALGEPAIAWSSSAGFVVFTEWPCWIGAAPRLLVVVHERDVAVVARVPEHVGARRDLLDLRRVVADAGRPPHVRHRVLVARVVARVGPLGAEVHEIRDQRMVELPQGAGLDEARARRRRSGRTGRSRCRRRRACRTPRRCRRRARS